MKTSLSIIQLTGQFQVQSILMLTLFLLSLNARIVSSFVPMNHPRFMARGPSSSFSHESESAVLLKSLSEMHTAYEYVARQRGFECIEWIDPSQNIVPTPSTKQMGFQVDLDEDSPKIIESSVSVSDPVHSNLNEKKHDIDQQYGESTLLRLPIYPVSAVHLPSSAYHTLHNTQFKNIKMARDLESHIWSIDCEKEVQVHIKETKKENNNNNVVENGITQDESIKKSHPGTARKCDCFVLTLCAQDTDRIASIGTLMEVTNMTETYANDKSLIRIVVECRAIDIVKIQGIEREAIGSSNDYLIGHVRRKEEQYDGRDHYLYSDTINKIVQDYAVVRSMYIHTDGVASRELPAYARDAVQSNLPAFTQEDFTHQFWDVAECWQMLCNTIRELKRSDLMTEMNEIMIDAACKQKGPLQLPVKRKTLPEDVQNQLNRMEQKQSEDFLSCGMDACLDFQVMLSMSPSERIIFLGELMHKEIDRLDTKERLKGMFEIVNDNGNGTGTGNRSNEDKDDQSFGEHFN